MKQNHFKLNHQEKALNQLNLDFYQQVFHSFSRTRSFNWSGWENLKKEIDRKLWENLRILDLGCGNGRFLDFLASLDLPKLSYLGLDYSPSLIQEANQRWQNLDLSIQTNSKFLEFDILNQAFENFGKFNLITLFGVMHHLPSLRIRQRLIENLAELVDIGGEIVFTTWNFLTDKSQQNKIVDLKNQNLQKILSKLDINSQILDEKDRFLTWKNQENVYRYCHYYTFEEVQAITLKTNLKIKKQYFADGKNGKLNSYWILTKEK